MSEFLKVLPDLLAGKTEFEALFVTYNEVEGYEDSGLVETGKPGLSVFINQGNLRYSPMTASLASLAFFLTDNLAIAERALNLAEKEACAIFKKVTSETGYQLSSDKKQLVVVYAGVSAFQESMDYARKLKKDLPHAVVAVLACSCDFARKEKILEDSIAAGKIDYAVCTADCGGRRPMGDILRMLFDLWPQAE